MFSREDLRGVALVAVSECFFDNLAIITSASTVGMSRHTVDRTDSDFLAEYNKRQLDDTDMREHTRSFTNDERCRYRLPRGTQDSRIIRDLPQPRENGIKQVEQPLAEGRV